MGADRTHLSIGEVLTLLQPDFPDITISKIRFLESQGLLDPERTPSGYRKFHDTDIDRLRWILTQQRDHFLPLKVIKDRLAAGDLGDGSPEGVLPLAADGAPAPGSPPVGDQASAPESSEVTEVTEPAEAQVVPATVDEPPEPSADEGPGSTADAPEPARAPLTLLRRAGVVIDDEPTGHPALGDASDDAEPDDHDRARAVARLVEAPESASTPAERARRGRRRHPTGHTPGDEVPPAEPDDSDDDAPIRLADDASVTLSLDDLCAATGLTPRQLGELERYGLLGARTMGSVDYYDEDALIVARLAVSFGRYGIEPRHLRMYKVAAEREAGLFEQLITPLLKQRRPAARQEAVEMLEDLAELADDLRAAMVRAALREYLGRA
ncbi:MerR family transcriptional regulator [Rhabdothermincola salaria]|uniref:MerR family transcriptional regulator n=1 Tax=Rhabdothermincola salaria TaxID=2903142 RepID=UPI001E628E75|nr:MerR family transcriptional regulator [Rhabdothermincola salaria]MCD9623103.1 MerR family DNA-binding transcriptional regulator [Rhabdothermincola salaria]